MTENEHLARIPDDRVAAILARAADLDRTTRETVSLDVIRAAALEAGISPAAVDRALEEYAAGQTLEQAAPGADDPHADMPRWRRWLGKIGTGLKFAVPTFLVGAFIAGVGEGGEPLIAMGLLAWLALAVRMAWKRRPAGRAWGYLQKIAVMALAGAFGYGLADGEEEGVIILLFAGVALMVMGTLAIKIRGRQGRHAGELADPTR